MAYGIKVYVKKLKKSDFLKDDGIHPRKYKTKAAAEKDITWLEKEKKRVDADPDITWPISNPRIVTLKPDEMGARKWSNALPARGK